MKDRGYKMSKWADIENNFYDDIEGCWCIDAWKTNLDDEEGEIIAKIYDDGSIEYLDEEAKTDEFAQEMIEELLDCEYGLTIGEVEEI